jgi:alpha-tubulin suppressor-like RCC1 family protein
MLGTGDTISHSKPILINKLKDIVDIGGGCFQSIALNSKGKLFSFGDNPSGQQGLGNFERCYVPKEMLIDIYGNKNEKIETKSSLKFLKIVLIAFGLFSIVILYFYLRKK